VSILEEATISKGWITLAGVLTVLETIFLYEAMLADTSGYQRIFGVFVGLSILCFAALLHAVSVVFYGWE
jgi:hypothetical protein